MSLDIPRHQPAFKNQIVNLLSLKPNDTLIDLTLGDASHTQEALENHIKVISFDVDPQAIDRALKFVPDKFKPIIIKPDMESVKIPDNFSWLIIKANMRFAASLMTKYHLKPVKAILADLGPSQYQVLDPSRGFSFNSNYPLDMRLDPNLKVTAADLINGLSVKELTSLFKLADEPFALIIAKAIVRKRHFKPIKTCDQLTNIIVKVKPKLKKIHPATLSFMALRMAVNLERETLKETLNQLPKLLVAKGRLAIISYHSGEQNIIDQFISKHQPKLRVVFKKPLSPKAKELADNPRVRSAKLNLFEKI